jgi:DNA-directed RNA polymerase specialized sigma subunit
MAARPQGVTIKDIEAEYGVSRRTAERMRDSLINIFPQIEELEIEDQYNSLHDVIKQLFVGIKLRDRRIVMERFGIGFLRPLQPKEIADMEHISVARVSQIINIAMEKMRANAESLGIDKSQLYQLFESDD